MLVGVEQWLGDKIMNMNLCAQLQAVRTFPQLVCFLRDEMDWPIETDDFEELTFEYLPDELGIDEKNAAKIQEIKRLRPLSVNQPWGIFFIKFEPKRLPVVALRRILSQVAIKKRTSIYSADRQAWAPDDLLFVSNYGEGDQRQISFAHFSVDRDNNDLPTLKVLGWDNLDTTLHLDAVAKELTENLAWPEEETNIEDWRKKWRSAFTLGHREVITTSKDLSIRLAKLARTIRDRIKSALTIETDRGPLTKLMVAFKETLLHNLDPDGFADMYAQTIAYGLLSARMANPHMKSVDDLTSHMRTNPFLRELMETFLTVGGRSGKAGGSGIDFDELGVSEVVQLLDDANLEAVIRDFGDRNPQEDPVIHFYELFLKEYDAKKRMQRGVFYTPRPVVSYIVRSVHELLQTEFGLEDGLADTTTWGEMIKRYPDLKLPDLSGDSRGNVILVGMGEKPKEPKLLSPDEPFVQILDPATGTATFLVEVIDIIHRTLTTKWKAQCLTDAQQLTEWNDYVPKHLLPRLHAFELMMAPYAIAHMKIGLKLAETGYHFSTEERARIYFTNALEPWVKQLPLIGFDALAHEAAAVNEIKRHKRFTVIIGNPPYSIQSQNLNETARAWVDAYRKVSGAQIVERNALQFEKNIQDDYIKFIRISQVAVDATGYGIVGMVTNHGFLDGATFRGMRWSLLQSFLKLWVLDLHGNSNKKESSPDGMKDENVFEISQGVAISIFLRPTTPITTHSINLCDLWGKRSDLIFSKYRWLLEHSCQDTQWNETTPNEPFFLFKNSGSLVQNEYDAFSCLSDIMPLFSMGIKSSRDELVLDFDSAQVLERIERFRSAQISDEAICEEMCIPLKKGWNVAKARKDLRALKTLFSYIRSFLYRPFDWRPLFYHKAVVFSAAYPVMHHLFSGQNLAFVVTRQTKDKWDVQCSRTLVGHKSLGAYDANSVFPLYLDEDAEELQRTINNDLRVNLSTSFIKSLGSILGLKQTGKYGLPVGLTPEEIFYFIYTVFHSSSYQSRYLEFLKVGFPRVPLPRTFDLFRELSLIGSDLVALHLLDSPKVERFITTYVGPKNPEVARVGWSDETVWLDASATKKGQPAKPGSIGFHGVPNEVWSYYIGGYQVCEKWLKDRKGRTLSDEDIAHYQKVVVALSETIRVMKEINEVIERHGGWPGAFHSKNDK
jgi:predicted helicase